MEATWGKDGQYEGRELEWYPPVALSDAAKADIGGALAAARQGLAPAERREAATVLGRLAVSSALEDRTEADWAMAMDDMLDDIADVPLDILEEACRAWRRMEKFFPKICELLDLTGWRLAARRRVEQRLAVLERVAADPEPDEAGCMAPERLLGAQQGSGDRSG